MKRAIKVYNVIILSITILCMLFAGLFLIPRLFGVNPYIVLSGSMEPVVHTGSVAFINTKDKQLDVGDIACYRIDGETTIGTGASGWSQVQDGTYITHRVIDMNGDAYIFKGDANEVADLKEVSPGSVVGNYEFSIPIVGYILAALGRKGLIFLVIAIIVLNIVGIILEQAYKDGEEKEEKEGTKAEEKELSAKTDTEETSGQGTNKEKVK